MDEPSVEITMRWKAWSAGDSSALPRLAEQVYPQMLKNERRGARFRLRRSSTMSFRLVDGTKVEWRDRAQFFALAIAAQVMRGILVNSADARAAKKSRHAAESEYRGIGCFVRRTGPVHVDEALTAFSHLATRQAKVVELRYLGGWPKEIVAALDISPRTVRRDGEFARAWLSRKLNA